MSEPISETTDRSALAPSDTENSATISYHSIRRARGDSGGGVRRRAVSGVCSLLAEKLTAVPAEPSPLAR